MDFKTQLKSEIEAFTDPAVFVRDILEIDWLWPWQEEAFLDFYNNNYKELIACVGQRCVHPTTRILTGDGTYKEAKDIETGTVLYGLKDGKIRGTRCIKTKNETPKEMVQITTHSGKKLKLSTDHRVYTQHGLVEASQLTPDHHIYVPNETFTGSIHDPDQGTVLGWMLGDGSLTNVKDEQNIKEFEEALGRRYDCKLTHIGTYDYRITYRDNQLKQELKQLQDKTSHNKFVPDIVFKYDEQSLIEFLRAIFKAHGTVNKHGQISYCSMSKQLIQDISRLLLKLGIRSYIDYTSHGIILRVKDYLKFQKKIGNFRKQPNNSSPFQKTPFKFSDFNIKTKDTHVTTPKLKKLNEQGTELQPIINGECYFDKIESVTRLEPSITYDFNMPDIGNFFAEDVLIKNSGKTTLASLFATYEAYKLIAVGKPNSYHNMPKGQDIFIINVATSATQAKDTIFSQIEARIKNSTWFQNQEYTKHTQQYIFPTDECNIIIRSEHSNSSSLAGHTAKCLAHNTRILTEQGYIPIQEIKPNQKVQDIDTETVSHKFNNGVASTILIRTSKGYELECTPTHKILTYTTEPPEEDSYGSWPEYSFQFKQAKDLNKEDKIPILLEGAHIPKKYTAYTNGFHIPLTFELGYILGCATLPFITSTTSHINHITNILHEQSIEYTKINDNTLKLPDYFNELIDDPLELTYRSNYDMMRGYLSGIYDTHHITNGTLQPHNPKQIQDLFRLFGIVCERKNGTLKIRGQSLNLLNEILELHTTLQNVPQSSSLSFPIPPILHYKNRTNLDYLYRRDKAGKDILRQYLKEPLEEPLDRYFDHDFLFDTIETVRPKGEQRVYDLEIDTERHEYTAQGFKVHNCVLMDECARFRQTTSGSSSADIVYETLNRTTTTFGSEGYIVMISSPLYVDDFFMKHYREAQNLRRSKTIRKATWECNPNITMEDLEDEFTRNYESAMRDYGAQPPSALETYFKQPEKIDAAFDETLPVPEDEYVPPDIEPIKRPCYLAGDPASKNDAFGIAMCHREGDDVIVDLAHRFVPRKGEVDAEKITDFILSLIDTHNVVMFVTDVWNFPMALQKIRRTGVPVKQNHVLKEEYDYLKELIYLGNIKIPESPVFDELKKLELVRGTKVDHPSQSSKDIADAVTNAVWAEKDFMVDASRPMAVVF